MAKRKKIRVKGFTKDVKPGPGEKMKRIKGHLRTKPRRR